MSWASTAANIWLTQSRPSVVVTGTPRGRGVRGRGTLARPPGDVKGSGRRAVAVRPRLTPDEVSDRLLQPRSGSAPLDERVEDPLEDGQLLVEGVELVAHGRHRRALRPHRLGHGPQLRRRHRPGWAG